MKKLIEGVKVYGGDARVEGLTDKKGEGDEVQVLLFKVPVIIHH